MILLSTPFFCRSISSKKRCDSLAVEKAERSCIWKGMGESRAPKLLFESPSDSFLSSPPSFSPGSSPSSKVSPSCCPTFSFLAVSVIGETTLFLFAACSFFSSVDGRGVEAVWFLGASASSLVSVAALFRMAAPARSSSSLILASTDFLT